MPIYGLFSLLKQKLALDVLKTETLHTLYDNVGPTPPPPRSTLLLLAVRIGILPFNSSSIALVSFFTDL